MMNLLRTVTVLVVFSAALSANSIVVDAGWYGFCFGGVGSGATAGCRNAATAGEAGNTITFTAMSNVYLQVTDAFQKGDRFNVNVDGSPSFATSLVPTDAAGATTDPDLAFADPTYSSGQVLLGPGSYQVDISTLLSPFDGGGAYMRVVSAPDGGMTLLLLGGALVGLESLRRRYRV